MHFGDWWGHSLSMVSCAAAERCSCLLAVSAASIVAVAMMESDVQDAQHCAQVRCCSRQAISRCPLRACARRVSPHPTIQHCSVGSTFFLFLLARAGAARERSQLSQLSQLSPLSSTWDGSTQHSPPQSATDTNRHLHCLLAFPLSRPPAPPHVSHAHGATSWPRPSHRMTSKPCSPS